MLPWPCVLTQMNAVLLETRAGKVRQNVGAAIWLTEGGGEGGHDTRIVPLVPEWGLTVHRRQNVNLGILITINLTKTVH
jgi:hypothetical protein